MSSDSDLTCFASRVAGVACCRIPITSAAVGGRPWEAVNASTRASLACSITEERGELLAQLLRDSLDLPLRLGRATPRFRRPRPAQVSGQLIGEQPVVQLGHANRGAEQGLGVEGAPPTVRDGLDPVEHHHMGVQLRVPRPRVPVVERRGHHPARPPTPPRRDPCGWRRPGSPRRRSPPAGRGGAPRESEARVSSATAQATDTDFGTENVRSNPATDCRAFWPRWSTNTVPGPAGARPSCSPVTGSCSIPSIRHKASSETTEPASTPAPRPNRQDQHRETNRAEFRWPRSTTSGLTPDGPRRPGRPTT